MCLFRVFDSLCLCRVCSLCVRNLLFVYVSKISCLQRKMFDGKLRMNGSDLNFHCFWESKHLVKPSATWSFDLENISYISLLETRILNEEVFVEQPRRFEVPCKEKLVYRLLKVLQTPQRKQRRLTNNWKKIWFFQAFMIKR